MQNVNVEIRGDVKGQLAIGENIVQIEKVEGIVVNVAPESERPAYRRRPIPVLLRPRAFASLLDREQEIESFKIALRNEEAVSIYGDGGIGKTCFVRQLAHLPDTNKFADGVVYLDASSRGLDDILQLIFDTFHENQVSYTVKNADVHIVYKPTESEIRVALRDLKALVFLDNLTILRNESESLLNAAPECILALSSMERNLWGEGKVILLKGLPEREALMLFEREMGRSLTEEEQDIARKIVVLLDGHPLHILQAASLVRERSRPLAEVLFQLQGQAPQQKAIESTLNTLTEPQENLLAILAASGGNILPLEHLGSISGNKAAQKALRGLVGLGLVQAHSPRYSLTGELASTLNALWDLSAWENALINYFIGWLTQKPQEELMEESCDVLIYFVKKASEKRRWREVIQLGQGLERFLILWKRWQAWFEILDLILNAAKALGNRWVEAWALHQLGSRAMCLELKAPARELLTEALNIRTAIGDKAGASVTRHNLSVLLKTPLPPGSSGGPGWLKGSLALFIALVAFSVFGYVVAAMTIPPEALPIPVPPIYLFSSDTPSPTNTITLTPSYTPTLTTTSTLTPSITPTQTNTLTLTPSLTPTWTLTSTPTPSPTRTPTITATLNLPPPAPIIVYPQEGKTLYCNLKDQNLDWDIPYDESGIAVYEVRLEKWPNYCFSWCAATTQIVSVDILDVSKYLECDVPFRWSVRARDKNGAWGPWSPWVNFKVFTYVE